MAKVDKKKLIEYAKKLNKLNLIDEEIKIKGQSTEDIIEDFISAIEEIDDAKNIKKVNKPIIEFYNSLIPDDDEDEKEDDESDDEDEEADDEADDEDEEADDESDDEDEDEEADDEADDEDEEAKIKTATKKEKKVLLKDLEATEDIEELEAFVEDSDLTGSGFDKDGKFKKEVKRVKKYIESLGKPKKADKKADKTKDKKAKKADKKADKGEKVKGLRSGTIPALIYTAIKDGNGDTTIKDVAEVIGKAKKKKYEKCLNVAIRLISTKISKVNETTITFNGDVENATIALTED